MTVILSVETEFCRLDSFNNCKKRFSGLLRQTANAQRGAKTIKVSKNGQVRKIFEYFARLPKGIKNTKNKAKLQGA